MNVNRQRSLIVVLAISIIIISYLYVDAIDVFIETNNGKQEVFLLTTAINYSEIMNSTTRGRKKVLIKSRSYKRVPIHIDNLIFFNTIYATIYNPDYVFQQKQYDHRSLLTTVKYPKFHPISWLSIINNKQKLRISEVPLQRYYPHKKIRSGEIVRIVDVLGHLRTFKEEYAPYFTKDESRQYLPMLREIVSYTNNNTEVSYDKLPDFDKKYLAEINHMLLDIEKMLK